MDNKDDLRNQIQGSEIGLSHFGNRWKLFDLSKSHRKRIQKTGGICME